VGVLACKEDPRPPPEARLATDLPAKTVDQILRSVAAQGGPRAERVAGLGLGASALPSLPETSAAAGKGAVPAASAPASAAEQSAASDVRWDVEPYGAIVAAAKGELLPGPATGEDVPDLWRDPGGTWVAVGGRAQVLLVATDRLGEHGSPARFTALTEPWLKGKVAIAAPTGGASLAHFAALYEAWGEARMRAWLSQLARNGAQVLPDDAAVRLAVVQGRAVIGLLGSDEAAKAKASAAQVEVVYPNQRSIGTFVWPTALSRPRHPPHPAVANQLAERLASRISEQLLVAREPGFLPLRKDIPVPPGVRSASNLVVVSVSPARIVELIAERRGELARWAKESQQW
jgi:ABC-type Fe3+ transport system substrate-binding protein